MLPLLFLFLFINSIIGTKESSPIVKTHLSNIIGYYKQSYSGRKYEAYEGIPYALPPVGKLRFEPPEPIQEWIGNISATKPSNSCIQYYDAPLDVQFVQGEEDCLYLNIYVPSRNNSKLLPVLFHIHGGAFQLGFSLTEAKFLMDRDVILVSINYRLGPFGFFSTEDDYIPGNMGLKDQSTALQWVSNNIKYFGGNPKKITLVGISAGAASVHYHYLSPWSKGLFQNGISFSGTTFGPGKQTENSREKLFKMADILGCPTEEVSEVVECLRNKPARVISEASKHFMPFMYNPFTPFGPVVENTKNKPFVDRSPIDIINSGDAADVLWLSGIVSEEGLYPVGKFINNDTALKLLNEQWESIAPHLLDYNFTIPLNEHKEVAKKIRNHYLGSSPIDRHTTMQLVHLVGDRLYVVCTEQAARWQAKMNKSPVLVWYYNYRASRSVSDYFSASTNNYGVCHSDDINMVFDNSIIDPSLNSEDRKMQIRLTDLVVSVAEKGYPDMGLNFEWKKVDPYKEELDFLHISAPDNIKMDSAKNLGEKNLWLSIDFDENKLSS